VKISCDDLRRGVNLAIRSISRLTEPLNVMFLCFWIPLFGCAISDRVDNRNFAVDAYSPTPKEIQLAQQRAQHYWLKHSQRFHNPTRYLAVDTTSTSGGDIYPKLIRSETTATYFSQDSQTPSLHASCIMIYDTVTSRFVSDSGYISIDLPPRGSVARWDSYMARYIGWGS
jgi:hypothetical protein